MGINSDCGVVMIRCVAGGVRCVQNCRLEGDQIIFGYITKSQYPW